MAPATDGDKFGKNVVRRRYYEDTCRRRREHKTPVGGLYDTKMEIQVAAKLVLLYLEEE